jgi:hypothetical protein
MNRDNLLTLFIFSIFILAPFISAYLDSKIQDFKGYLNKKLEPYGLRIKERV